MRAPSAVKGSSQPQAGTNGTFRKRFRGRARVIKSEIRKGRCHLGGSGTVALESYMPRAPSSGHETCSKTKLLRIMSIMSKVPPNSPTTAGCGLGCGSARIRLGAHNEAQGVFSAKNRPCLRDLERAVGTVRPPVGHRRYTGAEARPSAVPASRDRHLISGSIGIHGRIRASVV